MSPHLRDIASGLFFLLLHPLSHLGNCAHYIHRPQGPTGAQYLRLSSLRVNVGKWQSNVSTDADGRARIPDCGVSFAVNPTEFACFAVPAR
jgi:hypothetical protein